MKLFERRQAQNVQSRARMVRDHAPQHPPPPRNILGILIFKFSNMNSHRHQPGIKEVEALFVTEFIKLHLTTLA